MIGDSIEKGTPRRWSVGPDEFFTDLLKYYTWLYFWDINFTVLDHFLLLFCLLCTKAIGEKETNVESTVQEYCTFFTFRRISLINRITLRANTCCPTAGKRAANALQQPEIIPTLLSYSIANKSPGVELYHLLNNHNSLSSQPRFHPHQTKQQ